MESLFHPTGNQHILDRIDKLSPIALSEWGVMTVSQMLEHCQMPLEVVYGTKEIKVNWMTRLLFGNRAKKQFTGAKPFNHGLPTAKEFKITHEPDFESAKSKLKELITKFSREGHAAVKVTNHPMFGELTHTEIDIAQWKHLDHHLKQFGV
jgi:hypothetical protein